MVCIELDMEKPKGCLSCRFSEYRQADESNYHDRYYCPIIQNTVTQYKGVCHPDCPIKEKEK